MTKTKMGGKQHDGRVTLILDSGKYSSSASKENAPQRGDILTLYYVCIIIAAINTSCMQKSALFRLRLVRFIAK